MAARVSWRGVRGCVCRERVRLECGVCVWWRLVMVVDEAVAVVVDAVVVREVIARGGVVRR